MGATSNAILSLIRQRQDLDSYRERHWTGTLEDYIALVLQNPRIARNAYQRLHDMILSHGAKEYTKHHERYVHYALFDDPLELSPALLHRLELVLGLGLEQMRLEPNFVAQGLQVVNLVEHRSLGRLCHDRLSVQPADPMNLRAFEERSPDPVTLSPSSALPPR